LVGLRDLARAYRDVRFYAISPDVPSVSKQLEKQIESDRRGPLGFSLLADAKSEVINQYGLRDPAYAKEKINGVPRPAVLVLDEKGRIRWAKIETDYRERPSNEEVASAIDSVE
jgi:peroxiredoxin